MLVQVIYMMDTNTVTTTCACSVSKELFRITVPLGDWMNWRYGEVSSQQAFPYLSPEEREMIQTGITPAEWDAMHKPPED